MRNFLHQVWKKLYIHWVTTAIAIVYAVILYMYYQRIITTQEWILATGSILTLKSLLSKDPDKVNTKKEFQVKDLPEK